MKFIITILTIVSLTVGCVKSEGIGNVVTTKVNHMRQIKTYIVDGIELTCISVGHGLSCNWEKYNKNN